MSVVGMESVGGEEDTRAGVVETIAGSSTGKTETETEAGGMEVSTTRVTTPISRGSIMIATDFSSVASRLWQYLYSSSYYLITQNLILFGKNADFFFYYCLCLPHVNEGWAFFYCTVFFLFTLDFNFFFFLHSVHSQSQVMFFSPLEKHDNLKNFLDLLNALRGNKIWSLF